MAFEFNLYVVFAVYVVLNSSEMTKSAMNPSYWQTYSHFSRHKHILFKIKHFLGGLSFSGAFVLFLFGRQLAHALVLLAVFFEHSKFLFLFFNVCVFFLVKQFIKNCNKIRLFFHFFFISPPPFIFTMLCICSIDGMFVAFAVLESR